MKFFTLILFTLFVHSVHAAQECKGDLTMKVVGLKNSEGQVKFDLDNSADTFTPSRNGKPSFMKGKTPVANNGAVYVFKNIPCGDYAIKIYHDENMNEDLDMKFIKIPKEDYSFSNCKDCVLPPDWAKAKFTFDLQHPEIIINF